MRRPGGYVIASAYSEAMNLTQPPAPGLVLLADRLQDVHADLGDPRAQVTFDALIDALSHCMIDLADGRHSPRVPTSATPAAGEILPLDPVSCSAAATHLRGIRADLLRVGSPALNGSRLFGLSASILDGLIHDLQQFAEVDGHAQTSTRALFHRQLRAWLAKLQPAAKLDA